jgi:hypothetical protein
MQARINNEESVNLISSVFIVVALLGVSLVVNGTFNHEYDLSRISIQEAQPLSVTDIENLNGNIISLHKNDTANPAWIVSGKWKLVHIPNNNTNINSNATTQNIIFNASLVMSSIDGIDSHRHKIADFKLSNMTFLPRNVIINGTISLTTSGDKDVLDNNIVSIPIRIQIPNLKTIIIEIENKQVKEHFGGSPIYGKVD